MDKCYVFTDLGGSLPRLVGLLEYDEGHLGRFTYARTYLESGSARALDPINLPLSPAPQVVLNKPWMFGVMLDAGPDDWGRRTLFHQGRRTDGIAPLIYGNGSGVGALLFSLSRDAVKARPVSPTLEALTQQFEGVRDIEQGIVLAPEVARLLDAGTSMGGARPKTVVADEGRMWLAKFPARSDVLDQPACEFASLRLARLAGLTVPDHRLVSLQGRNVLLIERFDVNPDPNREGLFSRRHYLSMDALLAVGRRLRPEMLEKQYSYMGLAGMLTAHGARPIDDRVELFSRMAFNVLLGHVDDHGRNHGVLLDESSGQFRLAPVFDIAPSNGDAPSVGSLPDCQAIGIGRQGSLRTLQNLLSSTTDFGLSRADASAIVARLRGVVAGWQQVFLDAGVTPGDIDKLQHRVLSVKDDLVNHPKFLSANPTQFQDIDLQPSHPAQ